MVCQIAGVLAAAAIISGAALLFMSREEVSTTSPSLSGATTSVDAVAVRPRSDPGAATAPEPAEPLTAPLLAGPVPLPPEEIGDGTRAASRTAAVSAPAATHQTSIQKDPIQDPVARVALFFVGADPVAEAYWSLAINDPGLSATERQDLIEDLNEDGISDPRNPAEEDLPLILARLELIETLAPDAMDSVNADAFAEAYEDLLNLALVAMGGGEPVR